MLSNGRRSTKRTQASTINSRKPKGTSVNANSACRIERIARGIQRHERLDERTVPEQAVAITNTSARNGASATPGNPASRGAIVVQLNWIAATSFRGQDFQGQQLGALLHLFADLAQDARRRFPRPAL